MLLLSVCRSPTLEDEFERKVESVLATLPFTAVASKQDAREALRASGEDVDEAVSRGSQVSGQLFWRLILGVW